MPSINDVLKEKFNVTGNNIAETLSKIEPGSGGGSNGTLIVRMEWLRWDSDAGMDVFKLDKTWKEIYDAFPNVRIYRESPGSPVANGTQSFLYMVNASDGVNNYRANIIDFNGQGSFYTYVFESVNEDDELINTRVIKPVAS